MESILTAAATSTAAINLLTVTKTVRSNSSPIFSHLHHHFSTSRQTSCLRTQHIDAFRLGLLLRNERLRSTRFGGSISLSTNLLTSCTMDGVGTVRGRVGCVSNSAASFATGGGGFGGNVGGGGGGGGGGDGEESKVNAVPGDAEDASALSSDVIILDVGGMTCGGCAASVKRILENQSQVSSASVNLTTETAIVWPVSEAKFLPNWQKNLGDALAKHLTTCGFTSNLRGQGAIEGDISV